MLANKPNILPENAKRARIVTSKHDVTEDRIRSAKNHISISAKDEFERRVVLKQHGCNFSIGDILLTIHYCDVSGKYPDILHAVTIHAQREQLVPPEHAGRYGEEFFDILYGFQRATSRNSPEQRDAGWRHDQTQAARLSWLARQHTLTFH
jgi:hypothetical protein